MHRRRPPRPAGSKGASFTARKPSATARVAACGEALRRARIGAAIDVGIERHGLAQRAAQHGMDRPPRRLAGQVPQRLLERRRARHAPPARPAHAGSAGRGGCGCRRPRRPHSPPAAPPRRRAAPPGSTACIRRCRCGRPSVRTSRKDQFVFGVTLTPRIVERRRCFMLLRRIFAAAARRFHCAMSCAMRCWNASGVETTSVPPSRRMRSLQRRRCRAASPVRPSSFARIGGGRALGRQQAVPGQGLEARQPALVDGRHVRQVGQALHGGHRQQLHLAAADLRHDVDQVGEGERRLARDHRLHQRRRAAIRDVHDVEPGLVLEQLHVHMRRGPDAGRGIVQRPRPRADQRRSAPRRRSPAARACSPPAHSARPPAARPGRRRWSGHRAGRDRSPR